MNYSNAFALSVITAVTLVPSQGFCWGQNGHRVVGEIAERHLTAPARAKVRELLQSSSLAAVSTWADEIRGDEQGRSKNQWHFATIPDGADYSQAVHTDAEDDVVQALHKQEEKLKSPATTPAQKAEALKLFVHFMGDLHQPLHVGRPGDFGANTVYVSFFGKRTNLHAVWDDELIEDQKLSFTELARFIDLGDVNPESPSPAEQAIQAATYEDAAKEDVDLRAQVYNLVEEPAKPGHEGDGRKSPNPDLRYTYVRQNIGTVKQQLLKAGIRLAGALNKIFK